MQSQLTISNSAKEQIKIQAVFAAFYHIRYNSFLSRLNHIKQLQIDTTLRTEFQILHNWVLQFVDKLYRHRQKKEAELLQSRSYFDNWDDSNANENSSVSQYYSDSANFE